MKYPLYPFFFFFLFSFFFPYCFFPYSLLAFYLHQTARLGLIAPISTALLFFLFFFLSFFLLFSNFSLLCYPLHITASVQRSTQRPAAPPCVRRPPGDSAPPPSHSVACTCARPALGTPGSPLATRPTEPPIPVGLAARARSSGGLAPSRWRRPRDRAAPATPRPHGSVEANLPNALRWTHGTLRSRLKLVFLALVLSLSSQRVSRDSRCRAEPFSLVWLMKQRNCSRS